MHIYNRFGRVRMSDVVEDIASTVDNLKGKVDSMQRLFNELVKELDEVKEVANKYERYCYLSLVCNVFIVVICGVLLLCR